MDEVIQEEVAGNSGSYAATWISQEHHKGKAVNFDPPAELWITLRAGRKADW